MSKDQSPSLSLIIAVYKRTDFLDLVLASVARQHGVSFEVIIAEDDEDPQILAFIDEHRKQYDFPIRHISQPDEGFRKNRILNTAIKLAQAPYLVFVDGDCILHKDFLYHYARMAQPSMCLFGRRVMLGPQTSECLLKNRNIDSLSFFRLLRGDSKRLEYALYLPFLTPFLTPKRVVGCNFCVPKKMMVAINGFDEDYTRPLFGEDTDVWRRLLLKGVKMRSTKFVNRQYHLHHETKQRDVDWRHNEAIYLKKKREGHATCLNGIEKINAPASPSQVDN